MNFNFFGLFGAKGTAADVVTTPPTKKPVQQPIGQSQTEFGKSILSMTDEQAKASWERREANEKYSQRRYMIGAALYTAYPDMDDSQSSILEREFAEMLPDENATRVAISRINSKQQSPEQILENLKKDIKVGNAVGVNASAPPINLGQIILSMTDAEAKASWEKREAEENRKARRFQIGMAIYKAYPEMDERLSNDLEREIAKLVMNSEEETQSVISKIKEKQQSPEQILEGLKKNMKVDNVVGVNSPAP